MRVFAIFGGLVLTVLIAVLVVPYFVNWSDYKGRFETAATQLTGMDVRVEGDADVRLLPFPSLSFTDVRLGDEADPVGLIERFSVDVELAPFLTGELHIFDMRLQGAQFVLQPGAQSLPTGEGADVRDLASIIQDIKLEQATITDGSVLVRDEGGGDAWRITALNGTLSADSRAGPFRYSGGGVVNGVPVEGQMSTGRLRDDGFSLSTQTQWRNRGIAVRTQGQVVFANSDDTSALPEQLHYDGALQVSPISDSANRLETPFDIEGVFVASENALSVDQYRASFGGGEDPYTVEGGFSLEGGDAPTYALTARGTQLNWSGLADGDTADNFDALLDQARGVFAQLPLPTVAGTVSIDLPAIIYGSTTLRDVRFDAVPAAQNDDGSALWRITRLEAKLPGRAQLEAYGEINLPGQADATEELAFEGHAVLASRQPSGLAGWLGLESGLALSQLSRAGFEADVRLTASSQTFSNLMVVLDNDRLEGSIERTVLGERPMLRFDLTGDALRDTTFDIVGDLLTAARPGQALASDVDLAVNFTESVHQDIYADRLKAALRIRPEQWSVDQFQVDGLFGASLAATATARSQDDGYDADFDVSVVSVDAGELVANMDALAGYLGATTSLEFPAYVEAVKGHEAGAFIDTNLTAKGIITGTNSDVELTANVDGIVGGTTIGGAVRFAGEPAEPVGGQWGIDANMRNARASTLAAQLGFSLSDNQPGDVTIRLAGQPARGMDATVNSQLVGTTTAFDGTLSVLENATGADISAEGALAIKGRDIAELASAFDVPLALSFATPTAFEFTSEATRDPTGALNMSAIDADIGGQSVEGDLTITDDEERLTLKGKLGFSALDTSPLLAAFAGLATGDNADTAFGSNRLSSLSARVAIKADSLTVPGLVDPLKAVGFNLNLAETRLEVTDVEAGAFDGKVEGRIGLQSLDNTMLSDVQLQMRDINVSDLPIAASGVEGRADISLSATGSGSSIQAMLGSLTGSGSVAASDVTLDGIDSAGLPRVIAMADEIGFGITDAQIADLVATHILAGRTTFEPINAPLSVTNGNARLSSVALQSQDQAIGGLASVQIDLGTGSVEGSMDVRFDANNALALGATPSLRMTVGPEDVQTNFDGIQTYIVQRSIEREQQRIAALQARLNERQRLRRAVRQAAYQRDQRLEAERIEAERLEAERLERERIEAERAAALERRERELAEQRRLEREAERQRAQEAEQRRQSQQRPVSPADPFRQEIERNQLPPPAAGPGPQIFDNLEFGN